jgi:hypothetical protein
MPTVIGYHEIKDAQHWLYVLGSHVSGHGK